MSAMLFLGAYPPPFGGIASHLRDLVPYLVARGHHCVVVSPGKADGVEDHDGFRVYRVRKDARSALRALARRPLEGLWNVLTAGAPGATTVRAAYIAAVAMRAAEESPVRPFLVSAYHLLPWGLAGYLVARMLGVPLALTNFGEIYSEPDFYRRHRRLVQRLVDGAAARMASSEHCARSYRQIGLAPAVEVVPYGVDLEHFRDQEAGRELRRQFAVPESGTVVLFVGRLIRDMGLDTLLAAAERLLGSGRTDVHFWICGASGELQGDAERLAATYPGQVRLESDVPFPRLPVLYAASDVVVAPSADHRACMGLAIKEAMAVGRPVIATNVGGIPEAVLDGDTGLLVPGRDGDALAAAIARLAGDAEARCAMGRRGLARAREVFSLSRTCERVSSIFERAIADGRSAR